MPGAAGCPKRLHRRRNRCLGVLAPALEYPAHDGAVVRRSHLDDLAFFDPLALDQESVGGNIREGHLCHETIMDLHPGGAAIFDYRLTSALLARTSAIKFRPMPDSQTETIVGLAEALSVRKISPVELTRACLKKIEDLNPVLNAFITVTADQALAQARARKKKSCEETGAGRCTEFRLGLRT